MAAQSCTVSSVGTSKQLWGKREDSPRRLAQNILDEARSLTRLVWILHGQSTECQLGCHRSSLPPLASSVELGTFTVALGRVARRLV